MMHDNIVIGQRGVGHETEDPNLIWLYRYHGAGRPTHPDREWVGAVAEDLEWLSRKVATENIRPHAMQVAAWLIARGMESLHGTLPHPEFHGWDASHYWPTSGMGAYVEYVYAVRVSGGLFAQPMLEWRHWIGNTAVQERMAIDWIAARGEKEDPYG